MCSACAHVHTPFLHLAFSSVFMRLNRNDMRLTTVKCGLERAGDIDRPERVLVEIARCMQLLFKQ